MLKHIIILVYSIVLIECLNLCGDWTQYKDIKCFKLLQRKATQMEALEECQEIDKYSSLITITDQEEQEFIYNLLVQFNNISMNAWIGMEYNGHEYDWMDGTDSNFTNWSEDAVKEGSEVCVRMSLLNRTLGKWTDSSCKRQALIVCQRKQILSLNSLKDIIEELIETNVRQEKQINSLIPLGFLYTQLPNQSSPQQLWPNMEWLDITQNYSGLFFRAEGSGSEPFGEIQQANQSRISNISMWGVFYDNLFKTDHSSNYSSFALDYDQWNNVSISFTEGYNRLVNHLSVYTTGGEVRPKNTAIRIWKRI